MVLLGSRSSAGQASPCSHLCDPVAHFIASCTHTHTHASIHIHPPPLTHMRTHTHAPCQKRCTTGRCGTCPRSTTACCCTRCRGTAQREKGYVYMRIGADVCSPRWYSCVCTRRRPWDGTSTSNSEQMGSPDQPDRKLEPDQQIS